MDETGLSKFIDISILGRAYQVPQGLTILKALEYAGFRLVRGCGCRGGVCGACVTVYRRQGDFRFRTGLACQTVVEPGMNLAQLPFVPPNRALYEVDELPRGEGAIAELYPELMRCVACNTCTKACPMDLQVMDYIAAAKRGDWAAVTELSLECVMCGMCALRCPAEITQFNIALLIRRLHGKSRSVAAHLQQRLAEVARGDYAAELTALKAASPEEISDRFSEFQANRGESV
ncbi:MAG: 4Fe-4S dicluster domain-containing protein [Deltaproteobacteria bacterium]|nr:4Fe-4S dicluster domain-containing protein [Deltaproteobacteria bacterium]